MKRIALGVGLLCFVLSGLVFGQEGEMQENEIYFVSWYKPHNDQISAFQDAVKNHNETYHSEDGVTVYYSVTGQYAGYYQFVQGPYTWTDWENRQMSEEHDNDWINNVMPLVEHRPEPSAWKRMPDYTYNPLDELTEKSAVFVITVKPGENARFMRILKEWHEANKAGNYDGTYNIYVRQFGGENQIAIVESLENGWAEFDDENNFRSRYEEHHGKMSWDLFVDDADLSIAEEDVVFRIMLGDLSSGM